MEIPQDSLICFPKKRIRFIDQAGGRNSPTHSNFILYRGFTPKLFNRVFRELGVVTKIY